MSFLSNLKQKINIKYFMIGYLSLILFFSSVYLKIPGILKGILIIIIYVVIDLIWTYVRDKAWYLPISSIISGLILSIVSFPDPSIYLVICLPLLAVASKQLLFLNKNRHIFNPASFAVAVITIITPAISWWRIASSRTPETIPDIVSGFELVDPSLTLFLIILIGGIFILWRQNRWRITFSFMSVYAISLIIILIITNGISINIFDFLRHQIFDSIFIFFATIMLIEPVTSTFPSTREEIVYGGIVGISAVIIYYLAGRFSLGRIDPLVYGLLIGDFVASSLFLKDQPSVVPKEVHNK